MQQLGQVAADSEMTLPHLATAFVRAHRAVTAVIIGPRTPEQLDDLIAASEHNLSDDLLDAIDALAAPGTETLPADYLTDASSLTDPRHRRR